MRAVIFYRISSFEHGRCVTDKIYAYELVMYYLLLLFIPDFYMSCPTEVTSVMIC